MVTCEFENGGKAHLRHVATHAIMEKDGAILLVKRADHLQEGGKWSLPAGYMEIDETAGEGVLRELYEETGWEAEVQTPFRINTNPKRKNDERQNVAIDFVVTPLAKTGTPDHESTDIAWVPVGEINFNELAFDHGESVELYCRWREEKFALPLFE
jgi:8-oxo-dGTP diphosphatase